MRRRTGWSSQAGRNKVFYPAAPGDDPRAPFPGDFRSNFPNPCGFDDIVPDNAATVRDDTPCPSRSPDNSPEPAVATTTVPFPDTPDYSNIFAHNKGESDAHNPPTGNHATAESTPAIEFAIRMDQTEEGSREVLLPKSQVSGRSQLLPPEASFSYPAASPPRLPTSLYPNQPSPKRQSTPRSSRLLPHSHAHHHLGICLTKETQNARFFPPADSPPLRLL